MADAIGILGFALHAAHKIYDVVQTIKDGPDEIEALQTEAERVRGFLSDLIDGMRMDDTEQALQERASAQFRALVKEARKLTESANSLLDKSTARKEDGSYRVTKMMWPLYAGSAKKLAEEFKHFNLSLCAVLAMRNTRAMQQMQLQLVAVAAVIRSAADQQRQGYTQVFDEVSQMSVAESFGPSTTSPAPSTDSPRSSSAYSGNHPSSPDLTSTRMSSTRHPSLLVFSGDFTTEVPHDASPDEDAASQGGSSCPAKCSCRCHRRRTVQATPCLLSPLFGQLYLQSDLLLSLFTAATCDDRTCQRTRDSLIAIKWLLPTWFAAVDAKMRIEAIPIHFCIQTPRVVDTLVNLLHTARSLGVDDIQKMLSLRQITLNDVDGDGVSVLHYMLNRYTHDLDQPALLDAIQYVLEAGAPTEWTMLDGLTPLELLLRESFVQRQSIADSLQSLQLTVLGPYLHEDLDETWVSLQRKLRWTDLHLLFADYRSPLMSLDALERMLKLPSLAGQLNALDAWGYPPLYYAIRSQPEAAEVLLRAGANPWLLERALIHAAEVGADAAISTLVRAGADVNERDQFGRIALHLAAFPPLKAASSLQRYRVALELVRHCGHTIDWIARDMWGDTPLDDASHGAEGYPSDPSFQALQQLYTLHTAPPHARYVPAPPLMKVEGAEPLESSTSLIDAGLRGDCAAIGHLIRLGAMVNERDHDGCSLLHLVAKGQVRNAYNVAVEVMRYGGYGVDWEAQDATGETAVALARGWVDRGQSEEARKVLLLLENRRLPPGEHYVFPCMDPDYCQRCSRSSARVAALLCPEGSVGRYCRPIIEHYSAHAT